MFMSYRFTNIFFNGGWMIRFDINVVYLVQLDKITVDLIVMVMKGYSTFPKLQE